MDRCLSRLCLTVLIIGGFANAVYAEDFRDLFNGKDLDGWVVEGAKVTRVAGERVPVWSVKDGILICNVGRSGFGFLRYKEQEFSDFAFRVEYRMIPESIPGHRVNGGLGFRTIPYGSFQSRTTRPSFAAYEVQMLDDAGQQATKYSTGSLYRYAAPTMNPVKPGPEWNTIEIECIGPRIRITINGEQVMDVDQNEIPDLSDKPSTAPAPKDKTLKGYVCLQSHTGRIEFRKVQIREIEKP